MKYFRISVMLVSISIQTSVFCQTSVIRDQSDLARAGQTLTANPGFLQSFCFNREIDFDSLNMSFSGNWPAGQSFSISSSPTGDTLLIGEGGMLDVMDISDPYNPVLITGIRARAIIDDSYYDPATQRIYLAAYFSGIEVWDVIDFSSPARICRIPTNSYPRGGVFARDNYVYIATVADGFYVADISDPENPVMVGHRPIPGNPLVWNSDFQGDFAYLAADNSGMKVIDFSSPSNPVIAGNYSGMVTGVCVRDTLAFIASSNLGLRVVNIKNPGSITLEGYCNIPGYPCRVTVSGNYAYVANSTTDQGGVNVVDISNPDFPTLISTYPGFQTYIAGSGDAIGATGGTEGCLILDVTDPYQPAQAYAWPLAGFTYKVEVNGTFGYTGSNGFRIFDFTDMSYPVQVGYHETDGSLVEVKDTVAVFIPKSMTANNPVHFMDISDPSQPEKIGQYMAPVMTWDLALKGNYAFVACWWDGFRVIDFSNPAAPSLKAHEFGWFNGAVPGVDFCYVQALDIYGNYLYLVDYQPFSNEDTKGLYVFDISNPIYPQFLSRYATLISSAQDIRAWGDYVYASDGNGGMEVIDVSDPYMPTSVGYCSLPDGANGVDISWPFVFVGDYILGGVQVVDVTIPSAPFVTAYYKPSGVFAQGVTVKDNYVVAGDGVCGFQVYDLLTATGTNPLPEMNRIELSVFPNPATEVLNISFRLDRPSLVSMRVLDLNGRELRLLSRNKCIAGEQNLVFNSLALPSGIYFLEMMCDNEIRTVKFLISQ